jgi:signal transduction histidine kinase
VIAISSPELLDAAAWSVVGARCRQSYLHDLRGSLQVFHSAIELLVRAANSPGGNAALAEKASALARRAIENHEKLLAEAFNQITPQKEAPATVDVGELVDNVLRFLRGDFARNSINVKVQAAENLLVLAQEHKFRLIILGLVSSLADALAPGSLIEVTVSRLESNAVVEFKSNMPPPSILKPEQLWNSAGATISPYELLLSVAQRWLSGNGGFLEPAPGAQLTGALRLYYPCARR